MPLTRYTRDVVSWPTYKKSKARQSTSIDVLIRHFEVFTKCLRLRRRKEKVPNLQCKLSECEMKWNTRECEWGEVTDEADDSIRTTCRAGSWLKWRSVPTNECVDFAAQNVTKIRVIWPKTVEIRTRICHLPSPSYYYYQPPLWLWLLLTFRSATCSKACRTSTAGAGFQVMCNWPLWLLQCQTQHTLDVPRGRTRARQGKILRPVQIRISVNVEVVI